MAIIEFVKKKPKTQKSLKAVIEYILNPLKTDDELCGGFNCDKKRAFEDFIEVKKDFNNKLDGKQCIHFIQSFDPKETISPQTAKAIADRLIEFEQFKGFQIVYSTHTDREHMHNHFVINSVNSATGLKWQQSTKDLQALKDFSDKICLEFGLSIIEESEKRHKSSGEYRAKQKGQSWKYELYLAVVNCMRYSNSKDDFIKNMEKLGYKTKWEDNRKYITFELANGRKCRNNKLYPSDRFTKEALLEQFTFNAKRYTNYEQNKKMNLVLEALNIFKSLTKAIVSHAKRQSQNSLESYALEEYLNTHELGSLWNNLKDEQSTDWER